MIAAVLIFLCAVSLLASGAAWAAEEGLRRLGVPTRWIWLGAMAASSALLFGPVLVPGGASDVLTQAVSIGPVLELLPRALSLNLAGIDPGALDGVLAIAWGLLSVGMLAWLVSMQGRLRRERSGWEHLWLYDRDVYLSPDRGPAVAGVLRPWIVLPRWALSLPDSQLRLVVLHEEEHLRGGDARLLAAALFFVVVTPWNPATWWQLRRLRMAMEMDCDRRVLRREPDCEQYGNSLLSVAAKASGVSLGLAAFTERSLSLKRRIVVMTARKSPWTPLRAGLLTLLAIVIGVQACAVESPFMPEITDPSEPVTPDASIQEPPASTAREELLEELAAGPAFTPFTVAPSIKNRREVIEAMERAYPPLLRGAGVGGTTYVYFLISETGEVESTSLRRSSGHPALDDAALRVADVFDFTPALNGSRIVPVWVSFPITFQVR